MYQRIYRFPHNEHTHSLTQEFVDVVFGRPPLRGPEISILAGSPGEAIHKYREYVEFGQAIGAYEW